MGKIEERTSPNPAWNASGCLFTGWVLARWFSAAKLSPPKVHPFAAMLHGAISSGIYYGLGFAIDKEYKERDRCSLLERITIAVFITLASIVIARSIVNHINLKYLHLDKINTKKITLRPITVRDSLIMETSSRVLLLLR